MKNMNPNNNIEELLKTHGKRLVPDELMQKRAMNNIRAHWQTNIKREQIKKEPINIKQRQTYLFRIAASVVLMLGAVLFMQYNQPFSSQMGINDFYAKGDVQVSNDGIVWDSYNQQIIETGDWLRTNTDSFATLTLQDNSQLRINHDTQIHLLDVAHIELIKGQVYHDADNIIHANNESNRLTISTTLGDIKHIGTRYLVDKSKDNLQVSVRNGLVEINKNNIKRHIQTGKQISIDTLGNQVERSISSYGSIWNWTQNARQDFSFQGKTLNDFIVWYAHENGFQIDWNQHQGKTKRVQLTGNIANLSETQQIKTIFLSTKFDYQINQGILTIL